MVRNPVPSLAIKNLRLARAKAAEISKFSAEGKRVRVLAGLIEVIDGALAQVQTWTNAEGSHERPAPQYDVARKAWMDIARLCGLLDPDIVVNLHAAQRPLDVLAHAAVARHEDRLVLYAALREGGHADEAARELGIGTVGTNLER